MIQEIADALAQSWRNFADAFVLFVPRLRRGDHHLRAGGFVVAIVARRAVPRLLAWLGFDRLAVRTGASEMLRVAEMPSAELLVAKIVFWLVWIGFIVSAVDALQLQPFQGLVEEFFRFVPRFLVALLVLALGFLVGNFRLARHAARIGERRTARRAPAEQHAAAAGHRDRVGDGARAAGPGDHRGADGVCDHVWRADAGTGDCVRPRRP